MHQTFTIINHFNERGVQTGATVQNDEFYDLGYFTNEHEARAFLQGQFDSFDVEVLEDEV